MTQMTSTSADNANASSSQTQPAFAQDLAVTCQGLIDDFRKARSTKLRSVQLLVEALAPKDNDTDDIKRDRDRALTSYISMLDEHERSSMASIPGEGGDDEHGGADPKETAVSNKRNRDEAEKDDDDIASPPAKKPIDESLFPFANSTGAPGLHPDLVETLLHKENYLRDLSLAKQRVLARPDCPDFPRSLWKPLLGGEFIDLDKILSGIYSLSGERKEVQKFGDFEVVDAGIKVTRHVTSHGEWNIAWAQYRRALLFTFPHRRNELDAYEAHIIGLFTAAPPFRVIQFDRAVRVRVGQRNNLLLSDFTSFHDLHTRCIVAAGATAEGGPSSSSPRAGGRARELCRRFNKGTCQSTTCRYTHACQFCRSREHGANVCEQQPATAVANASTGRGKGRQ
ncbi:hypothetical protein AB1N83_014296 [Pleurotus pulmonarius]